MNCKPIPKNRFAAIVALFISLLMPTVAKAQEAYAVEEDATLTFYYDDQRANRTGTVYGIDQTHSADNNHPVWASSGWGVYNDKITKVVFDSSFKNYRPLTTESWFYNCRKIATIEGVENLNTENVTHMGGMFWGCESLTSLDVTGFNTAKVTNMLGTFYGCSALTSLDVSGFVTDNVTIMDGMFNRCSKLSTIDVSGFNTENVTDMHNMFLYCSALEWLDLSNFNTEKVTDMHEMFLNCGALETIYCNDAWTCDNSTNMFSGCTSLKGAVSYSSSKTDVSMANPYSGYFTATNDSEAYAVEDGTTLTFYYDLLRDTRSSTVYTALDEHKWTGSDITKVVFDATFNHYLPTSTAFWFQDCSKLETIEGLDNLNTTNVTDMSNMFNGCSALTTINCSRAWTCNESTDMFKGCTSLIGAVAYDASKTDVTMANPLTGYFTCDIEAYAFEEGATLTFCYDKLYGTRTGTVYGIDQKREDYNYFPAWAGSYSVKNDRITKVVFDASFKNYAPTSTAYWFAFCISLETVEGIENLNTENVTDMNNMFSNCESLKSLDVTGFNTENVTNMRSMFSTCRTLTSLDLSNFNTAKVTDMSNMFYNCIALTYIDLRSFNTTNVTDMSFLFRDCNALTKLNLSSFNTEKITDMSDMFSGCRSLTELDVTGFNTARVTNMNHMFAGCNSLTSLDVTGFNTARVIGMNGMFSGCYALTELDLSNFNTKKVTNIARMFYVCKSLKTIYCDDTWSCDFSTDMFSGCTALKGAVAYDESKVDVSMANPKTGYFTYKTYAVEDGTTLTFYHDKLYGTRTGTVYYIGNTNGNTNITKAVFDASFINYAPTSTASWFHDCTKLATIEGLDNLNTENVTDMSNMFNGCSALTTINCTRAWTCDKSTDMFKGCTSLKGAVPFDSSKNGVSMANPYTGYFTATGEFEAYAVEDGTTLTFYYDVQRDTRTGTVYSVTDDGRIPEWANSGQVTKVVFRAFFNYYHPSSTSRWFYNCTSLETIEGIENLNTENVIDMSLMFNGCSSLTSVDVSGFNTANVTEMYSMFDGCSALTSLDVSGFNTANVTDMGYMFNGCESLASIDVSKLNTERVRFMESMFNGCAALTTLDVTNFATERVRYMDNMFRDCSALTTIKCDNTWTCGTSTDMFKGCTALKGAVEYDENATDVAMANPKTGYFTGEGTTAISEINADAEGGATVIYNLHGVKMHDDLQSLPAGIYIVNGKKVIVK